MVMGKFKASSLLSRLNESLNAQLPQQMLGHPEAVALEHPDIINAHLAHPPLHEFADIVGSGQVKQVEEIYREVRRFGISPHRARLMRKVVAEKLHGGTHSSIVSGAFYLGGDDESIADLFLTWLEQRRSREIMGVLADLGERGSIHFGACYIALIEYEAKQGYGTGREGVPITRIRGRLQSTDPCLSEVSGCVARFTDALRAKAWNDAIKEMDFAEATGLVNVCSELRRLTVSYYVKTMPDEVMERAATLPGNWDSLIGTCAKIINTENQVLLERVYRRLAGTGDRSHGEGVAQLAGLLAMEIGANAGSVQHPNSLVEAGALLARDSAPAFALLGILVGRFDVSRITNVLAAWRDLSAADINELEGAIRYHISVLCKDPKSIFSKVQGHRIMGDVSYFSLLGLELRNDYSDDEITVAYTAVIEKTYALERVIRLWLGEGSLELLREMINDAHGMLSIQTAREAYIKRHAAESASATVSADEKQPGPRN